MTTSIRSLNIKLTMTVTHRDALNLLCKLMDTCPTSYVWQCGLDRLADDLQIFIDGGQMTDRDQQQAEALIAELAEI